MGSIIPRDALGRCHASNLAKQLPSVTIWYTATFQLSTF
jgi:hypothetical protein